VRRQYFFESDLIEYFTGFSHGDGTVVTAEQAIFYFGDFVAACSSVDDARSHIHGIPVMDVQCGSMVWSPVDCGVEGTCIYRTLASRIHRISEYFIPATSVDDERGRYIRYCISCFCDSMIPLVIYAEKSGVYSDAGLLEPQEKFPAGAAVALKPSYGMAICETNMPNISTYLSHASFWGDKNDKLNKCIPLVHLLSKALPQRCLIRGLLEIFGNRSREDSVLFDVVMGWMFSSLIGGYKHCVNRASFALRKKLYHTFYYSDWEISDMMSWLGEGGESSKSESAKSKTHKRLLFFAIKETLIRVIKNVPALHDIVCRHYYWNEFEESVCGIMDGVRAMVQANFEKPAPHDLFDGVESYIFTFSKTMLQKMHRPTAHSFEKAINKDEGKMADEAFATRSQLLAISAAGQSSTFPHGTEPPGAKKYKVRSAALAKVKEMRIKALHDLPTPYDQFPQAYEDLLAEVIECYGVDDDPPLEILCDFGVPRGAIDAVQIAKERYELEGNKSCIKKTLASLNRYCHAAVCVFYRKIYVRRAVKVFPLPKHHAQAVYYALRKKWELRSDQHLPKEAGDHMFCMQCRSFRGSLISPDKKDDMHSYGHANVVVDPLTMRLFCGGKRRANKSNKDAQSESSMDPVALHRRKKKESKDARKCAVYAKCRSTPVRVINLRSHMVQFFDSVIMLCGGCGNPMSFDIKKITGASILCGVCVLPEEPSPNALTCYICDTKPSAEERWNTYRVMDDTAGNINCPFETAVLCSKHDRPWVRETHGYIRKSILIKGIDSGWWTYKMSDGSFVSMEGQNWKSKWNSRKWSQRSARAAHFSG
jgi:hypothetical protein